MDWSVVFAIVVFAAVLQLAFFWYYLRAGQRADSPYPRATGESADNPAAHSGQQHRGGQSSAAGEDALVCPECGHENHWDVVFTYCGNCVTKIGR